MVYIPLDTFLGHFLNDFTDQMTQPCHSTKGQVKGQSPRLNSLKCKAKNVAKKLNI